MLRRAGRDAGGGSRSGERDGGGRVTLVSIAYTPLGYSEISPPISDLPPLFGSTVRRGVRVCVAFSCLRLGRFSRYNWEYMRRI